MLVFASISLDSGMQFVTIVFFFDQFQMEE